MRCLIWTARIARSWIQSEVFLPQGRNTYLAGKVTSDNAAGVMGRSI